MDNYGRTFAVIKNRWKRLEEERKKADGYEEERPPTPPPEDIKLKEIGVAPREDGTIPPVQGFVLVGFPQNKEHIEALKDHNILFDRILILTENGEESEEEPGTVLKKRGVDFIKEFSLENELNKSTLRVKSPSKIAPIRRMT